MVNGEIVSQKRQKGDREEEGGRGRSGETGHMLWRDCMYNLHPFKKRHGTWHTTHTHTHTMNSRLYPRK